MQRRRFRHLAVLACLFGASSLLVACAGDDESEKVDNVEAVGSISFGGYSANGSTFTVEFTGVHPKGACITGIIYQWSAPAYYWQEVPSTRVPIPQMTPSDDCPASATTTATIPTRDGGGTLHIRLRKYIQKKRQFMAWTSVEVPAYTAAPTAVAFAHATPAGDERTMVDARQSTGTGTLSYAWSPSDCAGTTDPGGTPTPAGTAWVANGYSGDCTVTVTSAAGTSATATVAVTSLLGLHNGSFTFDGSTSATIKGSQYGIPGYATTACVDLTGSGAYTTAVPLTGTPSKGTVTLTAVAPGTHRVAATFWASGANADCAITTTTGAVQTITDLYTVSAAGAVASAKRGTRAARAASYTAPSSLRFAPSETISGGKLNQDTLVLKGATMNGTFTWRTPKTANGVKRPVAAGRLAKGDFVMRSIDMVQGPLKGAASTLLGTGTVLLRGTDGTLACATLAGGFADSALTLKGGTGSAATLAGNVTGSPVTYVFPKPPAASSRVGTRLLAAVGWLTGSVRAAKKPAKAKPVRASGTANLQTAAKATKLPAACASLKRYLP